MLKSEFIPKIAPLVQAENKKRGYPLFSSVVIAQAICESGWGQTKLMMKANAIFGIKAGSSWKGKVYNAKTQECYDGKTYTNITACFRAYDNLSESISDYFDLITKSQRYRKACIAETPKECIQAIKNGGYATSPLYVNIIMSIIKKNNLTQYDIVNTNVESKYKIGKNYKLKYNIKVRAWYGTSARWKNKSELTTDGKKNAVKLTTKAVLKKGTTVTCKNIYYENNNIWFLIPSGYIAVYYKGKEFIE